MAANGPKVQGGSELQNDHKENDIHNSQNKS